MLESVTPLSLSPPPAPLASHSGPVGDVAADLQGFRVLRAQYPHVHRQQRGVLVTGRNRIPRRPGPAGDVAAEGQGVRVLAAQHPHIRRQQRGRRPVPGQTSGIKRSASRRRGR